MTPAVARAVIDLVEKAQLRLAEVKQPYIPDLPTEIEYNPLDENNVYALAAIMFAANANHTHAEEWITPQLGSILRFRNQLDARLYDFIYSQTFAVRVCVQHAAIEWVRQKFGEPAAHELTLVLDDDDATYELSRRSEPI